MIHINFHDNRIIFVWPQKNVGVYCRRPPVGPPVRRYAGPSVRRSVSPSVHLSVCPSVRWYVGPSTIASTGYIFSWIFFHTYTSTKKCGRILSSPPHPSVHPYVRPSVCPSVRSQLPLQATFSYGFFSFLECRSIS